MRLLSGVFWGDFLQVKEQNESTACVSEMTSFSQTADIRQPGSDGA